MCNRIRNQNLNLLGRGKLFVVLLILAAFVGIPSAFAATQIDIYARGYNTIDAIGISQEAKEQAKEIYSKVQSSLGKSNKAIKVYTVDNIGKEIDIYVKGKTVKALDPGSNFNTGTVTLNKEQVETAQAYSNEHRDEIEALGLACKICMFGVQAIIIALGIAVLAALYASGEGLLLDFLFGLVGAFIDSGFLSSDNETDNREDIERKLKDAKDGLTEEQRNLSRQKEELEKAREDLEHLDSQQKDVYERKVQLDKAIEQLDAKIAMYSEAIDNINAAFRASRENIRSMYAQIEGNIELLKKNSPITQEQINLLRRNILAQEKMIYQEEKSLLLNTLYEEAKLNNPSLSRVELNKAVDEMLKIVENGGKITYPKLKNIDNSLYDSFFDIEKEHALSKQAIDESTSMMSQGEKGAIDKLKKNLSSLKSIRTNRLEVIVTKQINTIRTAVDGVFIQKDVIVARLAKFIIHIRDLESLKQNLITKINTIMEEIKSVEQAIGKYLSNIAQYKKLLSEVEVPAFKIVALKIFQILKWIFRALTGLVIGIIAAYVANFVCQGMFPKEAQMD